MQQLFTLNLADLVDAKASEMGDYVRILKTKGLLGLDVVGVPCPLIVEGTILSGRCSDTAVPADVRTVLSDIADEVRLARV